MYNSAPSLLQIFGSKVDDMPNAPHNMDTACKGAIE